MGPGDWSKTHSTSSNTDCGLQFFLNCEFKVFEISGDFVQPFMVILYRSGEHSVILTNLGLHRCSSTTANQEELPPVKWLAAFGVVCEGILAEM